MSTKSSISRLKCTFGLSKIVYREQKGQADVQQYMIHHAHGQLPRVSPQNSGSAGSPVEVRKQPEPEPQLRGPLKIPKHTATYPLLAWSRTAIWTVCVKTTKKPERFTILEGDQFRTLICFRPWKLMCHGSEASFSV